MCRIVICGLPGCTIFFHIILKTARFYTKNPLLKIKCVFWFSLQRLCKTFLILRRTERDVIKLFIGLLVKYSLFLSYFNETWILSTRTIFRYQIPFKSLSSGSRSAPYGQKDVETDRQTDRHDAANSLFSQFCECA